MLALIEYEALTCPGCGGYIPETTDESNTHIADLPHRCFKCTAIGQKRDQYKDADQSQALVIWPVKMR